MKQFPNWAHFGKSDRIVYAHGGPLSSEFDRRLQQNYAALSDQLKRAGDFVAANPIDTATRSLRAVAGTAGLPPATFSRLAKALEYPSFDALRDSLRDKIGERFQSFAERAEDITQDSGFAERHLVACRANLTALEAHLDPETLAEAVEVLTSADRVFLFGALGATGIVEYFRYLAQFCVGTWEMVGRQGSSLGGGLADMGPRDVFLVVTKPPYSSRALRAVALAAERGARVIVMTDDRACPALRHATCAFILPTESPHFYSSYVATLTLIEILIGMVVGRTGDPARARIAQIEQSNRRLEEVWDG